MATPPFSIDESLPGDNDIVSQHPGNARTFRDVVEDYLNTDHDFNTGRHKFAGLVEQSSDPANVANTGYIYTKDDGGDTELYYIDDGGTVTQITQDGVLLDAALLSAANTFAAANTFSDIATFSAQSRWAKGSDIVSAATLVLGTDGNYFDVTGNTGPVTAITVPAGTLFMLQFDSNPTFNHGASLDMPGEANITFAAGDRLICFAEAANTVQVLSIFRASGRGLGLPAPNFTSSEQTVTADTVLSVAHGLGAKPSLVQVALICKTADLGYSVDDEVLAGGNTSDASDTGITIALDTTNVVIVQASSVPLVNQSTLNRASITVGRWRWVVRAWK